MLKEHMQQRNNNGLRFPQRNPSDKNLNNPCRHLSSSWLDSDTRMGHDDLMSSRQDFLGPSGTERLHELAKDLGECYMAADLPALLSQKREREVEQTVPRIDKSRNVVDKTGGESWIEPLEAGKGEMQSLLINLLAGALGEATLDQISRMRSPMNGIYLYEASAGYRERQHKQYLRVIEQGEADEFECTCSLTLQGVESTGIEAEANLKETGKRPLGSMGSAVAASSNRGQRLPSALPPSEAEESKSSISE